MNSVTPGTKMSLAGVALLAACACGAAAKLARLGGSYSAGLTNHMIHPIFAGIGAALILAGLWRRQRHAARFAAAGIALLALGEFLVPPMSIGSGTRLTMAQIAGLMASVAAGALLVFAFYRAFPSPHPRFALTAMSGAGVAVGCNCCLVTMGIGGMAHALFPAQFWLTKTVTLYSFAAVLMVIGLLRIGGVLPAAMSVIGQAWVYFWLELPYSSLPSVMLNGVDINFIYKYPNLVLGTSLVAGSFVLAYRIQEARATAALPDYVVAGPVLPIQEPAAQFGSLHQNPTQ